MTRYHGPRDYLDAASSVDTPPDELCNLATSEYSFVRLALAKNPSMPPPALYRLLPASMDSFAEQQIAAAIASRPDAPPDLLVQIAESLNGRLHAGSENHDAFAAGVALCCNRTTPFSAVRLLLAPNAGKPLFRKVVARECQKPDVLNLLATDPSTTVSARARAHLQKLAAVRPDDSENEPEVGSPI